MKATSNLANFKAFESSKATLTTHSQCGTTCQLSEQNVSESWLSKMVHEWVGCFITTPVLQAKVSVKANKVARWVYVGSCRFHNLQKSIIGHRSDIHQVCRHGQLHSGSTAEAVLRCAGRATKAASWTSVLSLAVSCLQRPKDSGHAWQKCSWGRFNNKTQWKKKRGNIHTHTCRQPLTIFARKLHKPTGFRRTAERPNHRY